MTDTDARTELASVLWPPRVGLADEQIDQLLKPLNRNRVATRSQAGQTLSYLEQHDVRAHLTRMFGFANWSERVVETRQLFEEEVIVYDKQDQPVIDKRSGEVKHNWYCSWQATVELTIKDRNGNVLASYSDVAIGGNTQPQRHEANDMSLKTAVSDALKRAAINLGDQFGLSLYQKGSTGPIVRGVLGHQVKAAEPMPEDKQDKLAHSIGRQGDDPANSRTVVDVPLPREPSEATETMEGTADGPAVEAVHDAMRTAVAASGPVPTPFENSPVQ